MLPLHVPSIGADFWVGNLHKWACAPVGSGRTVGGPAVAKADALPRRVVGRARRLSEVLRPGRDRRRLGLAGHAGLRSGCSASLGWDRVRAHNEALVGWAQSRVAEILGVPPGDLRHDPGLSMALVRLPPGCADTPQQAQEIQDHW